MVLTYPVAFVRALRQLIFWNSNNNRLTAPFIQDNLGDKWYQKKTFTHSLLTFVDITHKYTVYLINLVHLQWSIASPV